MPVRNSFDHLIIIAPTRQRSFDCAVVRGDDARLKLIGSAVAVKDLAGATRGATGSRSSAKSRLSLPIPSRRILQPGRCAATRTGCGCGTAIGVSAASTAPRRRLPWSASPTAERYIDEREDRDRDAHPRRVQALIERLEDAEDIAFLDGVEGRERAIGKEEATCRPSSSDGSATASTRFRVWRAHRGFSGEALGAAAGSRRAT